ncbi:MAG: hypothetical protein IRY99_12350 [Isosphaeraceae bacterium]|nr:hypothetical protein [Isosphaeraceae bacterium]
MPDREQHEDRGALPPGLGGEAKGPGFPHGDELEGNDTQKYTEGTKHESITRSGTGPGGGATGAASGQSLGGTTAGASGGLMSGGG